MQIIVIINNYVTVVIHNKKRDYEINPYMEHGTRTNSDITDGLTNAVNIMFSSYT